MLYLFSAPESVSKADDTRVRMNFQLKLVYEVAVIVFCERNLSIALLVSLTEASYQNTE